MTAINTHGIKINLEDLKKASEYTENVNIDMHQIIHFDLETGEILTWAGMRENWVEYRNQPEIIKVASTRRHCSEQQIADWIADAVYQDRDMYKQIGWEWPYTSIIEQ